MMVGNYLAFSGGWPWKNWKAWLGSLGSRDIYIYIYVYIPPSDSKTHETWIFFKRQNTSEINISPLKASRIPVNKILPWADFLGVNILKDPRFSRRVFWGEADDPTSPRIFFSNGFFLAFFSKEVPKVHLILPYGWMSRGRKLGSKVIGAVGYFTPIYLIYG